MRHCPVRAGGRQRGHPRPPAALLVVVVRWGRVDPAAAGPGRRAQAARTVRVEAAGTRVEVPARDGGERLGRAFFLAELPARRPLGPVRVTALDGTGTAIRSWALGRCG